MASRRAFVEQMRAQGFSQGLTSWMGSNLVQDESAADGQLTWAFDIAGATDMYRSYRQDCYWELLAAPPDGVTINVLRAGDSDRWDAAMITRLEDAVVAAQARHAGVRNPLSPQSSCRACCVRTVDGAVS